MVLVRRIRKRGANIVVEANGEVLFAPTGDVGRWTNRFSQRVLAATAMAAPTNKRPRWGHYGKPLRSTFRASTTYQPGRMKVYAAVGSTAPHAYYVDQGTGVYNGSSPYEAKVLPPWEHGSPSLYESTWRPGGPNGRRVAPVMIRGQRGQFFFDTGLKRGFESMRMRSFQVPGEGTISKALSSVPTGLLGFLGNTPNNGAFRASLSEWRTWRDAAYKADRVLGRGDGRDTNEGRRRIAAARASRKPPAGMGAYLASKQAAERRRQEQVSRLRRQQEAKARGEERRAERERLAAKNLARAAAAKTFEKARVSAYEYLHAIEKAYPDAQVQISKDKTMIRVHYTGPNGQAQNEYFLR